MAPAGGMARRWIVGNLHPMMSVGAVLAGVEVAAPVLGVPSVPPAPVAVGVVVVLATPEAALVVAPALAVGVAAVLALVG